MKKLIATMMVLALAAATMAQIIDGKFINELGKDFETPHLDWAQELPEGELRALFVLSLSNARHAIEAAQRMDVTLDAVTTSWRNATSMLGISPDGCPWGRSVEGTGIAAKHAELGAKLDSPYELVVVNRIDFDNISDELKLKLFMKVREGCGLMLLDCRNVPGALLRNPVAGAASSITSLATSIPESYLKTYQFGNGRILAAAAGGTVDIGDAKVEVSSNMVPVPFQYDSPRWWALYENAQAYFMRAMLWTAGREPKVEVDAAALAGRPTIEQGARSIPIQVRGSVAGELKMRLRDEFNQIVVERSASFNGDSGVAFDMPVLAGGDYYLDLIADIDGGTDNFGFYAFKIESPTTAELLVESDAVKGFSPIRANLKLSSPIAVGTVSVSLEDLPYGRIWYQAEIDIAGKSEIPITIENYFMPTLAAFLKVEVKSGADPLSVATLPLFFPAYMSELPKYFDSQWEINPGGPDILRSLAEAGTMGNAGQWLRIDGNRPSVQASMLLNQRLMSHNFGVLMRGRGAVRRDGVEDQSLNMPREPLARLVDDYYAPGELTEDDLRAIEAPYVMNSPTTERLMQLMVGAQFRNKSLDRYPLATYGLGNEVNIPYDLGFSPADDTAFRRMLERHYGTIEKLNAEWGRNFSGFDAVPHPTLQESLEKQLYPEYLAHVRYVNNTVAFSIRTIAADIKRRDPNAVIGMDGVWNNNMGFNMEDILRDGNVNTWGPYTRLPQLEILRSMRPDLHHLTVWGWETTPKAYPEAPWFNLVIGTCHEASWFISGVNHGAMKMGADYTPYHENMQEELHKLRSGVAQALIANPLRRDGVAIWENYNSTIASRLGDQRFIQTIESAIPLIDTLYHKGINFDYIVEDTMDKLGDYKILFLCGASSLGDKAVAGILDYVKNGGTVVADLYPGLMNDSFRVLGKNRLAELFGECAPAALAAPAAAPYSVDGELNGRPVSLAASEVRMFPGVKPFQVREYGKGRAVLLNGTIGSMKLGTAADDFNRFMVDLLAAASVSPDVKFAGLPPNSVARVRRGQGFELVAVTNRSLAAGGNAGGKATVSLPGAAHFYEVGHGAAGKGMSLEFEFAPPFKVFSVFKDEQRAPEIKLSDDTTTPGEPLVLDVGGLPAGRIMRLQVRDRAGKVPVYRNETSTHEVFATDGRAAVPIHFAYNYPKGDYVVTLTDVITGLASPKVVTLR